MPRFVPLPDRDGPAGSARMWINPEHVVSLVPKVHRDGTHHILRVEIKLVGTPAFDAWLGKFDSGADADTRWGEFLRDLGNQVRAEG
ncbi:hypothetical protein NVV95_17770 [Herbiconiux sp. CPCC 205716]|uniref:Uncharacterized protein n=1 Tax=Herbiconiux gentiana TaxID=2970912 RepID=A0ABT2GJL5_9MICO|nr:hypothetical protein [Herbiconiux gentiana]MCS5716399.1 hypothetical protein [Herbiconiux gentiana]